MENGDKINAYESGERKSMSNWLMVLQASNIAGLGFSKEVHDITDF